MDRCLEFSLNLLLDFRTTAVGKQLHECKDFLHTVFPRFSTPHNTSNFDKCPPSDKHPLQISLDFDQKDGEPELFLNQPTSKSLCSFFFVEYSVKYLYAVQKMISS